MAATILNEMGILRRQLMGHRGAVSRQLTGAVSLLVQTRTKFHVVPGPFNSELGLEVLDQAIDDGWSLYKKDET